MHILSFAAFQAQAKIHTRISVYREVSIGDETPNRAFLKIGGGQPYSFLLESVEGDARVARYSFLGKDPFLVVRTQGRKATLNWADGRVEEHQGNPFALLRQIHQAYSAPALPGLPRFYGGAIGYFAYDMVRYVENLPDANPDPIGLPESQFMFYDTVLVFDHVKGSLFGVHTVSTKDYSDLQLAYQEGLSRVDTLLAQLDQSVYLRPINLYVAAEALPVRSNFAQNQFEAAVARAKDYIAAGDVFQVVLSQRFEVEITASPFDIYRVLILTNPSPYMYFLNLGAAYIVGASPEMLVRVEEGMVTMRPIAGTKKRGRSKTEDDKIIQALLNDPKECAEHIMLVDLGRNDLGRVGKYGSVRTTELMTIEKYSHVIHIVSNVVANLREDQDLFNVIQATFPAGTLSGAPKVRAMEVIDELETLRRGVYGGALGYLGFTGTLDTCITIRTMVIQDGKAYIQAGAGVVADSDETTEYHETRNKAAALIRALKIAEANTRWSLSSTTTIPSPTTSSNI